MQAEGLPGRLFVCQREQTAGRADGILDYTEHIF